MRTNHFRIFFENPFEELERLMLNSARERIRREDADYLLRVSAPEYVAHIVDSFLIEPVHIDFAAASVTASEEEIPAQDFPNGFFVRRGQSYSKPVITYHLPFSGDESQLRLRPDPAAGPSQLVEVGHGQIRFRVVDFAGDPATLKQQGDSAIAIIRTQMQRLTSNIEAFHRHLQEAVAQAVAERLTQLRAQQKTLEALGVPIRPSSNVPATFRVPVESKPVRVRSRPSVSADPTLDKDVYEQIMTVLHETGRNMERLPSTYADKDEETLRDHLILVLEPHFQGSTTGETFNKNGKTDILIRHEGKNIFVAECKFWSGHKNHKGTIHQILSYLTWRDSKAAIVYFVRSREIAPALKAIADSTPEHPNFVRAAGRREESWFDYVFHLPGDPERELSLAVLCFHFPPAK